MTDAPKPYAPEDGAVICLGCDVPEGYEARSATNEPWFPHRYWRHSPDCWIVEARPIRRTVTIEVDKWLARQCSTWVDSVDAVCHALGVACRDALARLDQEDEQ